MSSETSAPRRRTILLAGILGGFLASVVLLLQVIPYGLSRSLTPVDEMAHVDYAIQLSVGRWPHWGDTYAQQTLLIADCIGNPFGPSGSCHPQFRSPTDYWPGGWSYEAQQPPLGYLAHAVTARAAGLWEPKEQLSWLRGTSLALTCLGLLLIGVLAGSIAPRGSTAFAVTAPAALLPIVVNGAQFVTNDSAGLVAGSIAISPGIAALFASRPPRRLVLAAAIGSGVVVALIKPVALIASLAMLLWAWFIWEGARRRSEPVDSLAVRSTLLAAGAGLVSAVGFALLQRITSSVSSEVVMDSVLPRETAPGESLRVLWLGIREVLTIPFHGVEPITEFRTSLASLLIGVLLVALTVASVYPGPTALRKLNALPIGLGMSILSAALAWLIGMQILGGYSVALPGRFLLALLPLLSILWLKGMARLGVTAWLVPPLAIALAAWMIWPIVPMWLGWSS